ncbi:TRAP transporter small permease [Paracoccus sp. J39]|uniref:TRAP transporter small permease n=1 Tax=Paracoccus sp. J39 TaxID=935848 RepID=UPI0004AE6FCC|nr:TRAP transporter small permease [Paracoccus sp. J39]
MSTSFKTPDKDSGLKKAILGTDRMLTLIERLMMGIASAAIVAMMLLVTADALLRYAFHSPLAFVQDVVVLYLLPASAFFAFSIAMREGAHIAVDAVANTLPQRLFNGILALSLALSLVFLVQIAWAGAVVTHESWRLSDTTGGVYPLLIWPSKIIVPIGMGLMSLRVIHAVIANLYTCATSDIQVAYPQRHNPYSDPVAPGAE